MSVEAIEQNPLRRREFLMPLRNPSASNRRISNRTDDFIA
jgi:hypothetical protein